MEKKRLFNFSSFFVVMFSVLVMALLRRGGYLARANTFWELVIIGALTGGFTLAINYAVKIKRHYSPGKPHRQ